MTFKNIEEGNFNSIMRRSLVWRPKPLFVDDEWLQAHYPDSHLDGIFAKDIGLREFLESGPAIAVSLRNQHGFEAVHNRDKCRALIEEYAVAGLTAASQKRRCARHVAFARARCKFLVIHEYVSLPCTVFKGCNISS